MRLQFAPLSSFLALCLCVLSIAAQSGSVSLQPSVSSDPGVPNVKVTADQQRVPLGTQVTFTLVPPGVVSDPLYTVTLFFGDGEKQVMKKAQTVHLYRAVGDYTYSILVKRNDGSSTPRVTLIAASPLEEGQAAGFSASLSPPQANMQYRFVFGDGQSSPWQANPQTSHSYSLRGVYLARVEVGANGRVLAVSELRQVRVTSSPSLSVYLTVTPPQAPAGETITLRARVSQARPATQYRFIFGDGQQSFWQVEPETQHVYKTPGRYSASVEVTQTDANRNVSGRSAPTVIAVEKGTGPVARPTPQTNPTPEASPTRNASPAPTGWPTPSGSSATPTNSGPVIGSASPAPSHAPSTTTDSRPVGPKGLWKYLLIAAVLLFLIYKGSGLLLGAQPTFAAFSDPGIAGLSDRKSGLPIDFQLLLRPNVSTGEYKVETGSGSLVQNYDRLLKREILEL